MTDLSKVVSLAVRSKKPSKAELHRVVLDLIQCNRLDTAEAVALYAYFLPPVPAKPKTPEQWVAKAVAKKDVRFYLEFLYSDGKRLMGTDGYRLHICPTEIPAGFYDRALNRCEVEARYPNVDQVIPKWDEEAAVTVTSAKLPVELIDGKILAYRLPTGGIVNRQYWEEATAGAEQVRYCTDGEKYRIDRGYCFAVVMGMRE